MKAKKPVIAVFDIGKTNKKLLLFDESYEVVFEESACFEETVDEDGFPCEDVDLLVSWVLRHIQMFNRSDEFQLKAINFSTYGASLVYLDAQGRRIAPLYNYLKTYPDNLLKQFHQEHVEKEQIAVETSSPIMGHLNAGLQLYWFKHERPYKFRNLHTVLHFPQFLGYQLTGELFAEMTNVGCHSAMWDFKNRCYHQWLTKEGVSPFLLPVVQGDHAVEVNYEDCGRVAVGVGLHDSSAAIIPYLLSFTEPFVIVSTGTWTISLNPFNKSLPLAGELENGCLSYQAYNGSPVKASMLFAGHDHDQQLKRIATFFNVDEDYFKSLSYDAKCINDIQEATNEDNSLYNIGQPGSPTDPCHFHLRNLQEFKTPSHAYHQLLIDIIHRQSAVTRSVINDDNIKNMYVDGGFSKNRIYMQLLADAFPEINVYATSMTQGTALGAALAIHRSWNEKELPSTLIRLKHWHKTKDSILG